MRYYNNIKGYVSSWKCHVFVLFIVIIFSLFVSLGPFYGDHKKDLHYAFDIIPDQRIDGLDSIALGLDYGHCDDDIENRRTDLDGSNCVDDQDLSLLRKHFGNLVHHNRPPLSAYCYYWYIQGEANWPDALVQPLLGYYDSRHPILTEIQNEWKIQSGLDIDIISWDGALEYANFKRGYENAANFKARQFFFLYETVMRLGKCGTINLGSAPDWTESHYTMVQDFETMATNDFNTSNYHHLHGRPVVMIWVTTCYQGDLYGTIHIIREKIKSVTGTYPFLICDELAFGGWDDPQKIQRIQYFDGVTSYSFYNPDYAVLHQNEMNEGYLSDMKAALESWAQTVKKLTSSFTGEPVALFLPAFPGFHYKDVYPPLYASVEQFQKQLTMIAQLAAIHNAAGIFITSFNEHPEDTAVEPSFERGFERLQTIQTVFGLAKDYQDIERITCAGPMVTISNYQISKYECPNQKDRLPYTGVNWYQATTICAHTGQGYRLCSQSEWEDACDGLVGPGGYTYPYGPEYEPGLCNDDSNYGGIKPSGSVPTCVSPFGIYDLSGNVGEFIDAPYPGDPVRKMNKGGTWFEDQDKTSCSATWKNTPDFSFADYGFRCCRTVDAQ